MIGRDRGRDRNRWNGKDKSDCRKIEVANRMLLFCVRTAI